MTADLKDGMRHGLNASRCTRILTVVGKTNRNAVFSKCGAATAPSLRHRGEHAKWARRQNALHHAICRANSKSNLLIGKRKSFSSAPRSAAEARISERAKAIPVGRGRVVQITQRPWICGCRGADVTGVAGARSIARGRSDDRFRPARWRRAHRRLGVARCCAQQDGSGR